MYKIFFFFFFNLKNTHVSLQGDETKKKADKNKKELSIQYLKTWDMRYDKNIL